MASESKPSDGVGQTDKERGAKMRKGARALTSAKGVGGALACRNEGTSTRAKKGRFCTNREKEPGKGQGPTCPARGSITAEDTILDYQARPLGGISGSSPGHTA